MKKKELAGGTTSESSCFEKEKNSRFPPFDLRETGLNEIGSRVNVGTVTHKFPHQLQIGFVDLEQK